ncbi:MAG: ATP-binding protein [Candidatus Glassbacteria bacterium]
MSLRKKILLGYSITLVLMGLVIGWAVLNLASLGKASEAILRENYRSISAAENMRNSLERQNSAILLFLSGQGQTGEDNFLKYQSEFLQWLARAKDNITIEGEGELLKKIEGNYYTYVTGFSELKKLYSGNPAEANLYYQQNLLQVSDQVRAEVVGLRDINQNTMFQASRNAEQMAAQTMISTISVGVIGLLLGLIFSLTLSTRLVSPLHRIVKATKIVAQGDYSVRVPTETNDELGQLAVEFNLMAEKLDHFHSLNIEQIVSEKRKSEAILGSIKDGIIVLDTDLRISNLNSPARRIFGAENGLLTGLAVQELVNDRRLLEVLAATVSQGKTPRENDEMNVVSVVKNEETQYYSFTISPIFGEGRELLGAVALFRDITRLKELDRLKSEFIMAASHELRTPLTSMGMSVDLLLERAYETLDEKSKLLLNTTRDEIRRLKILVNELLDLSKIESGNVSMDFQYCPLQTLFDKVISVFNNQAAEKSVALRSELSAGLPKVKADVNKITWVLTNLLSNALRYVPGNGEIILSAASIGDQVQISVSDNGPGIPIEYQSRIFDKFVQIKGDTKSEGSGLGLAICKEIVRAHRGTIWVDSMPGKGSTFNFTLPGSAANGRSEK